jgi:hypothetical protein
MSNIYVFDTKTNQWDLKIATGATANVFPSTRTAHTAVVSKFFFFYFMCVTSSIVLTTFSIISFG